MPRMEVWYWWRSWVKRVESSKVVFEMDGMVIGEEGVCVGVAGEAEVDV